MLFWFQLCIGGVAGRPAGGIDILMRSSLCVKVDLKSSFNNRVNAVVLDVSGK